MSKEKLRPYSLRVNGKLHTWLSSKGPDALRHMIEEWILEEETKSAIPSKAIIALQKRINALARKRNRLRNDDDYVRRKADLDKIKIAMSCRDKLARIEIPLPYGELQYRILSLPKDIFNWTPEEARYLDALSLAAYGAANCIKAIDEGMAKLRPDDMQPVVSAFEAEMAAIDREIEACRARIRELGGALSISD